MVIKTNALDIFTESETSSFFSLSFEARHNYY